MRRTTLAALLFTLVVAGWIALFERDAPDLEDGEAVFAWAEEDILAVEIERPGEPVVRLSREEDGFLVAEGDASPAPADAVEADLLLQNVTSLRFERRIEAVSDDLLADFGLGPPGLVVRVVGETGEASAGFGDETPAPGNRYLLADQAVLVVPAFARGNFDKKGWDLRDKRVFRFESPAARGLRLTAAGETVELAREAGSWRIVRPFGFAADPYEASGLATRLLDAGMLGLAPETGEDGDEEDPFGLAAPRLTAGLDLAVGPEEIAVSRTIRFGGASRTPPGVFARVAGEPLVFVVSEALVEELAESAAEGLSGLRSLRLFGFAAFRAAELRLDAPDGETVFRRVDGEAGREWTMATEAADPIPADATAVEDLLYALNSTDAEGVGGEALAETGANWTITVTEENDGSGGSAESGPESVRIAVAETGGAEARRTGDDRTLVLSAETWDEVAALLSAARTPEAPPD